MLFSLLITLFGPLTRHFIRKVEGLENLPRKAPYIIAVNHASFADPVFLTVALRKKLRGDTKKIHFFAKRKLIWLIFTYPLAEKIFNLLIINPKNKKDVLRRGENILKKKRILTIFYEGTRTRDGKLQKGKTGAARIALKLKLPVVPVLLQGTREFWGRGMIYPRYKRNVEIRIGTSIYLSKSFNNNSHKDVKEATAVIEGSVKSLLKQK